MKFILKEEHRAVDSALILCFREACERPDVDQIVHMARWLDVRVQQYDETPPHLAALEPVFDVAREGWDLMLQGVLSLLDFVEQGDPELLEQARELAEEGEALLQELEEAIVDARDERPVCEAHL
jgi:hypothetical protein